MAIRKNDWGWPDVHTGECAAFSGRIDQHAEAEHSIGHHGPLTDADVGVNVIRGDRRDNQVAGMPESAL